MIDIIKAILRSKGINPKDVKIDRITMDVGNGITIPTNDWNMAFEYEDHYIAIELNELNTRDSWASLVKYYDGDMIYLVDRVELANLTPRELYEIIEEFIHR